MKQKQILSVFLVFALILGMFALPAFADNEIDAPEPGEPEEPYLYVNRVISDFNIENSVANIIVRYIGITNITTRAEISIKLQHRFLFWWFDVSGGEWNDTVYGVNGSVDHSLALTDAGDFRAVINVKVYGTGSGYDEINNTPTASN